MRPPHARWSRRERDAKVIGHKHHKGPKRFCVSPKVESKANDTLSEVVSVDFIECQAFSFAVHAIEP
jgi:hypothetical protein